MKKMYYGKVISSFDHLRPLSPELIAQTELKRTRLGPSILVNWRPPDFLDDQMLLSLLPPEQRQEATQVIDAAGVNRRFLTPSMDLHGISLENVRRNTAKIGTRLLLDIQQQLGWEKIDRVIDTSLFLDENIYQLIAQEANLPPTTKFVSYRVACAGFAAAFIDSLADPSLVDNNIIILSREALGALFHRNHLKKENFAIPAIFGDHYVGFGFKPADYQLLYAESHVIPDNGVIRSITYYQKPQFNQAALPPHYVVSNTGESIFGYNERGAFIDIQAPDEDISTNMKRLKTAAFFGKETPPIFSRAYQQAYDILPARYPIVFHNPSRAVVELMNKYLAKDWRRPDVPLPQIPYLLDAMHSSNSSSATTPDIWQFMADEGMLDPSEPFIIGAPGIGSLITVGAVLPRF